MALPYDPQDPTAPRYPTTPQPAPAPGPIIPEGAGPFTPSTPAPEVPDYGSFSLPSYGGPTSPRFNFANVPRFEAPQFAAPSLDEALKEPGYQFRLQSGQSALERSAAAKGVLRTGGTLKDLVDYGQQFGAQEYSNVFNRALQGYGARYQAAKDMYAPKLAEWQLRALAEKDRALAEFARQGDIYSANLSGARYRDSIINDLINQPPPSLPPSPWDPSAYTTSTGF